MRVKSPARREAIIEAACEAFRERGFEAASMTDVSARVGGSKATLYSYFSSKEELFVAVMMRAAREQAGPIFEAFQKADDLPSGLRRFGRDYLHFMIHPDIIAIGRMCVASGEKTGVARAFYDQGIKVAWAQVAERLEQAMAAGELRRADSWRAAWHIKGLCEAGVVDRRLRGCITEVSDAEIDATVDAAVDVFLRAYLPETPSA